MVPEGYVQDLIVSHLKGFSISLEVSSESPGFTILQIEITIVHILALYGNSHKGNRKYRSKVFEHPKNLFVVLDCRNHQRVQLSNPEIVSVFLSILGRF